MRIFLDDIAIDIHSVSEVITNSSTVTYVFPAHRGTHAALDLIELIGGMLGIQDAGKLVEIELVCDTEYLEYLSDYRQDEIRKELGMNLDEEFDYDEVEKQLQAISAAEQWSILNRICSDSYSWQDSFDIKITTKKNKEGISLKNQFLSIFNVETDYNG